MQRTENHTYLILALICLAAAAPDASSKLAGPATTPPKRVQTYANVIGSTGSVCIDSIMLRVLRASLCSCAAAATSECWLPYLQLIDFCISRRQLQNAAG
jgi:hypothetical protein